MNRFWILIAKIRIRTSIISVLWTKKEHLLLFCVFIHFPFRSYLYNIFLTQFNIFFFFEFQVSTSNILKLCEAIRWIR